MFSRNNFRFSHRMTPRELVDTLNELAKVVGDQNSVRTVAPPLLLNSQGVLSLNDSAFDWFVARLVGVYTLTETDVTTGNYPGMKAGTNLYSFVEQSFDATTGLPVDANPGRQTSNAYGLVGTQSPLPITAAPTAMFAVENNNGLIVTPLDPGPYVEMRLRGIAGSVPVYEFGNPAPPLAWVKVTATGAQTIYLTTQITGCTLTSGQQIFTTTGNLNPGDIGAAVSGPGVYAGTTISNVDITQTPIQGTLDFPASSDESGVTLTLTWTYTSGGPNTAPAPQEIYLGRTITDGVLQSGINSLQSASLVTNDVGSVVVGSGIPGGIGVTTPTPTTITAVNTDVSPPIATLSANATANVNPATVTIISGTTIGLPAEIDDWSPPHGTLKIWPSSSTWDEDVLPWVTETTGSPPAPKPAWLREANGNYPPFGERVRCLQTGTDAFGVPIYSQQVDGLLWAQIVQSDVTFTTTVTVPDFEDTAQKITLSCYLAQVYATYYGPSAQTGPNGGYYVWFYPINSRIPTPGDIYQVRAVDIGYTLDQNNNPMWLPVVATRIECDFSGNSTPPAGGPVFLTANAILVGDYW